MTQPFHTLAGRVRVLAGEPGRVVGAGVQLTAEHVLTCWHVMGEAPAVLALGGEAEPVPVETLFSVAVGPRGEGDLAVLRTAAPLTSPPAALVDCGDADLDVRIVGHPAHSPAPVLARARLVGPTDPVTGWRQLDRISVATVAVDRGFSGAAVFEAAGRVVGMATARSQLGPQTVGWMLPVRRWQELLPADLAAALLRPARLAPPTPAERTALALALAEVPTVADPLSRQELIDALPAHLRLHIRVHHRLGLDCRSIVGTALDHERGIADLYDALLALEGPSSIGLAAFRELAETMRLLPHRAEGE
ncbi:trypsin-like peptidase domain-containing protein [Longispora sp. K20-0274]|uniref:trypsin-like peptidase domain-containing protein n=1 Tax=Longispora sp. K20-0274 TaxID=3088255 RepID=UPI00399A5736